MKVRSKTWIEANDKLAFGAGRVAILRAVAETGSLNRASERLAMSYRHAWSCIRSAETQLGRNLLKRKRGGTGGGGATLTPFAHGLVERFEILDRETKTFVDKRFAELFGTPARAQKRRPRKRALPAAGGQRLHAGQESGKKEK